MITKKALATLGLLLLGLLLLASCGKKEEGTPTSSKQESSKPEVKGSEKAGAPVDPATAATVTGVVKYAGAVPKPQKIDMSQDPACAKKGGQNVSETIVADNGNLANAFVYVKEGLGDRSFPPPSKAAVIDQDGCRYHPHVLGVMAGQNVEIKNSDDTTHNIHPTPKANREWNESQSAKAAPLEKSFAREEIMLPVKCNQHPWMKMYVNVVKNPFFAVTDKDGKYDIKGLPPGDYTIAVVHEKLGEQTQKVTVAPKDSKTVDFSYKEGGATKAAGAQQ
jgi:plastocyanin